MLLYCLHIHLLLQRLYNTQILIWHTSPKKYRPNWFFFPQRFTTAGLPSKITHKSTKEIYQGVKSIAGLGLNTPLPSHRADVRHTLSILGKYFQSSWVRKY